MTTRKRFFFATGFAVAAIQLTPAQVLVNTGFESIEGYLQIPLAFQGHEQWQTSSTSLKVEDCGLGGGQCATIHGNEWVEPDNAWTDITSKTIGSSNVILMVSCQFAVADDFRQPSTVGLDTFLVPTFEEPYGGPRAVGLRVQPRSIGAGSVNVLVGDAVIQTSVLPPTLGSWFRGRVYVDLSTGQVAGDLNGESIGKDAPYQLSSRFTPYLSRVSDGGIFVDNLGYNDCCFDSFRIEAMPPGRISGKLKLQAYLPAPTGTVVTLAVLNSAGALVQQKTISLASDGSFSTETTFRGIGYVTLKAAHWLKQKSAQMPITKFGVQDLEFELPNGDCDGNNYVGTDDYLILNRAFDTSVGGAGFDPRADLNGDGYVGTDDYLILNENFDMSGD